MERLVDGRHVKRRKTSSRKPEASAAVRKTATVRKTAAAAEKTATVRKTAAVSVAERVGNIRVIIRHLLEVCPLKLLPRVLSVSKEWKSIASKFWTSEATLKITPEHGQFTVCVENTGLYQIVTAQELGPLNLGSFKRYHMSGWEFPRNVFPEGRNIQELIHEFRNQVDDNVENLVISKCIFDTVNQFKFMVYLRRPKLRHIELRKLTTTPTCLCPITSAITSQPVSDTYYRPPYGEHDKVISLTVAMGLESLIPVSWVDLLSHFPYVEEITISYLTEEGSLGYRFGFPVADNFRHFLDAIRIIRNVDPTMLPLRRLKVEPTLQLLNSPECYKVFSRIRQLGVQLQDFWIDMNCTLEQIRTNIAFHRRAIERLHVENLGSYNASLPDQLRSFFSLGVHMEQLKELTLCDNDGRGGNLKFLKFSPNLKKLRMYSTFRVRGKMQFPNATSMMINTGTEMDGVQLHGLVELYFGYVMDNDQLLQLMQWLPNVRFLTINLDDEQFGMVCTHWPKLQHLHLFGKRLSEDGLAGSELIGKGFIGPLRPNIGVLRELTCFKMEGTRTLLTDVTRESLLRLPKLRYIHIPKHAHRFDKRSIGRLRRKLSSCWFRERLIFSSNRDFCRFIHEMEGRQVRLTFTDNSK